jgi:hypothetical protein
MNWELLFEEFKASWKPCSTGWKADSGRPTTYMTHTFHPSAATLQVLGSPTEEDAQWLIEGLNDERESFVIQLFTWAPAVAEVFFAPLLNAGIEEIEPSGCGPFVRPCSGQFGAERVREYLYSIIEAGNDDQKAGAAFCLYWAPVPSPGLSLRLGIASEREPPRPSVPQNGTTDADVSCVRALSPESSYPLPPVIEAA